MIWTPPLRVAILGQQVPARRIVSHSAAPPPFTTRNEEPLEAVTIIRCGCARLRVAEFPILAFRIVASS
jgi:hypothetical protein